MKINGVMSSIDVDYIVQLAKSYHPIVKQEWTLTSQFEDAEEKAAVFAQKVKECISVRPLCSMEKKVESKPKLSEQIAIALQAIQNEKENIDVKTVVNDSETVSLLSSLRKTMSSMSKDILGLTQNMDFLEKRMKTLECSTPLNVVQTKAEELSSDIDQCISTPGKRVQPAWISPSDLQAFHSKPQLKLYNSLTRKKELFIPENGNQVKWYSCGPTVYDASHMGHARSYITFDILRRVLSDYFGYKVLYCMNITDIDDKIITRARHNHLLEKYQTTPTNLQQVKDDVTSALDDFSKKIANTTDPDKKNMLEKMKTKSCAHLGTLENSTKLNSELMARTVTECKDPLADWLDKKFGSAVTDNLIFSALPKYWEKEYFNDMDALNVAPPDVLTRVSEYVPEIVAYVQQIISNGYGYESNGSVYFSVSQFDSSPNHFYAKLVPEAAGDLKALQEGEELKLNKFDVLRGRLLGSPGKSDPLPPVQAITVCPVGRQGRPGWHIECSVMACSILGSSMDIHTGGVDLKFPHHDNEIAQAEAHYNSRQWVHYFLHSGHLTIAGCKMSKSLKNFITIKDALSKNSSRQLRFAFLLHSWKDTLDYNENTMHDAVQYEKFMNEFFLTVKDILRNQPTQGPEAFWKVAKEELDLLEVFSQRQQMAHNAFCDNIDTKTILDCLRHLVTTVNSYLAKMHERKATPNGQILKGIAQYVTRILKVFGAISGEQEIGFPLSAAGGSANVESTLMPYLTTLSNFREEVRSVARQNKDAKTLELCDALRDDVLPPLGVRLEDKEGARTVVKLVDPEVLMKEREEKKKLEEKRRLEKEAAKRAAAKKKAEKEAQRRIPANQLFVKETDKYSKFDEQGFPTHMADGKELSKGLSKKLRKLYDNQEKVHNEYLKELSAVNGN